MRVLTSKKKKNLQLLTQKYETSLLYRVFKVKFIWFDKYVFGDRIYGNIFDNQEASLARGHSLNQFSSRTLKAHLAIVHSGSTYTQASIPHISGKMDFRSWLIFIGRALSCRVFPY